MAALEQMLGHAGLLPLTGRRILEVGCGSGKELVRLLHWGAQPHDLFGVDLMRDRLREARRRFPDIHFQHTNAERLPFGTNSFDIVLLCTIFTSILDTHMAATVAGEIERVLRGDGVIIWYDFRYNNPYNINVRGIGAREIQRLFPDFELWLRPISLLPPLARHLGSATSALYPLLAALPMLRSHYLGILRRRL
jgi:ubiquinone/menaquinone biosynthesis C-methylase UbiE